MTPPASPGRLVLVALVLGYFVVAPLVRHGLRLRTEAVPGWYMFTGIHTRTCRAELYVREDGLDRRIRASEVLGRPPRFVLQDAAAVDDTVAALCRELGPDADLRADARCGHWNGWTPLHGRERDLCGAVP